MAQGASRAVPRERSPVKGSRSLGAGRGGCMTSGPSPGTGQQRKIGLRLFRPILAGATLRERLIGCVGALVGIILTGLICGWSFGQGPHIPLIVAPIGASAVLLFAVPASPLAHPWSIIGGNTISAFMGVLAARFVPDPVLAIGVGVSLAIAAMSLTRSLHPPGGAAALTALIGGPAVTSAGFLFPLFPVALNSVILVGLGLVFHKLSGRRYPHVPAAAPANPHRTADPVPALRVGFKPEDVDQALRDLDETLDIDPADLDQLLRQVEGRALARIQSGFTCADVMSRDVVTVGLDSSTDQARSLLLAHNIRTLPVTGGSGQLLGTVGLREVLSYSDRGVGQVMSPARTARPWTPLVELIAPLTDGRSHAVVITDEAGTIAGIVTQSDALAALTRQLSAAAAPAPG